MKRDALFGTLRLALMKEIVEKTSAGVSAAAFTALIGILSIALLIGTDAANAEEVILDGDKVIRIENLEVFDDQGGPMLYDVDFLYDTGKSVYGPTLNFDFQNAENAAYALGSVLLALNDNDPQPTSAGPNGTNQFFIGNENENGLIGALGGEYIPGNPATGPAAWAECVIDCEVGVAILSPNIAYTYAKFRRADGEPPANGPVDLSGTVESASGTPLCAMVLASGQYEFSCNPDGPFSLTDLPREPDNTVKRQVYVDGFFPNVEVLEGSVDETVVMQPAGSCPNYNVDYNPGDFPDSVGKRVNISGSVLLGNSGTPVCAMVLANGQYMFSCDGSGSYALNIPLDDKGQFKLQVYADGFAPLTQRFDEFSLMNDVRLARAAECN